MASDFIKEKIKDKPVNKRKILAKFLTTVVMAIIFGAVAAVCYYYTLRGIETVRGDDTFVNEISIPGDDAGLSSNETVSQGSGSEEAGKESEGDPENTAGEKEREKREDRAPTVINNITNKVQLTPENYEKLYADLHEMAMDAEKALVTVTGSVSNKDWFDNTYENSNNGAGLIIDENGRELMILTDKNVTDGAETVSVTFCDQKTSEARIVRSDSNTGLETVAVQLSDIDPETMEQISTAKLGNSTNTSLVGLPVIAVGNPLGMRGSEAYGLVTSNSSVEQMTDLNTRLITTDIYGSSNASGVIINYSGDVLGVITNRYSRSDTENMITAFSISDIKNVIERLVNDRDEIYMGIYGIDVNDEAQEDYGVPEGAYVTGTVAGSPAMSAGIQSGDIIVKIGDTVIEDFDDYSRALSDLKSDGETAVAVKRFSKGDYQEMIFKVEVSAIGGLNKGNNRTREQVQQEG